MRKSRCWFGVLCGLCALYFVIYTLWEFRSVQAVAAQEGLPPIVVIDAGPGGEDSGALSISGKKESDINLAIALRLEQVLALCGIRPKMIRSEDVAVSSQGDTIRERKRSDLNNRLEIINHADGVLVSIHQNHFPDSKYHGAQVFYASTDGSKQLAAQLQTLLRNAVDPSNRREIKRSESVFIMNKIKCTGILVECGFLSNPAEESLLLDHDYQTKISAVIGCALAQHFEKGETDVEI